MSATIQENAKFEVVGEVVPVPVYQGCPHFGLRDDPETKALFATPRARCFRHAEPQVVDEEHQTHFCLRVVYGQCAVYQGRAVAQAAPSPARSVARFLGWIRPFPTTR